MIFDFDIYLVNDYKGDPKEFEENYSMWISIEDLLKENKEVNLYISSDYYLSFVYNHYVGEKSTHYRKEIFKDLGIVTSYPNIIYQTFKDSI